MFLPGEPGFTPYAPEPSNPAVQNPAIKHCCDAWHRMYRATLAKGRPGVLARFWAERAYKKALPPLTGVANIRDFAACVAHGILIEAIQPAEGARLLYAAQVAHQMRHKSAKKAAKKRAKSPGSEPAPKLLTTTSTTT